MPKNYSGDARIGARIAAVRRGRGMTQEDLVSQVNLRLSGEGRTRSWIAGIEVGKTHPRAGDLEVIAAALDTTAGAFLGATAEPNPEIAALFAPFAEHLTERRRAVLVALMEEFAASDEGSTRERDQVARLVAAGFDEEAARRAARALARPVPRSAGGSDAGPRGGRQGRRRREA